MKRLLIVAVAAALLVVPAASAYTDSSELREAVELEELLDTLEELEEIADDNAGTRASGTPGYAESVEFLIDELRGEHYRVTVQNFPFAFFQELAPDSAPAHLTESGDLRPGHRLRLDDLFRLGQPDGTGPAGRHGGVAEHDEHERLRDGRLRAVRRGPDCAHAARHVHVRREGRECTGRRGECGDHLQP